MKKILTAAVALSVLVCGVVAAPPAWTQESAADQAVAVCDSARQPFLTIRQRNREAVRNRVIQGVAIGVLGGGALGGAVTQNRSEGAQNTAMVVGAVLGGIAGGMNQYIEAKRQITNDNRELARLIDADARGYAGRIASLTSAINSTQQCRQNQISVWEQRLISTRQEFVNRENARRTALAAATDDRARRDLERQQRREAQGDRRILDQMDREEAMIQAAIADDTKLFGDVLKYFDDDIMAMAQAQAQVEGTSAASLHGPAEGYSVQVIPPALLTRASAGSSAFGSATSAFGTPAATPAPALDLTDPSIAEAQVVRPQDAFTPGNGHQAAMVAQRDAAAYASATDQSNRARLQLAVARAKQIDVGTGGSN